MEVERPYFTWKDSNSKNFYHTKVLSKAALISVSNDLIKEININIFGKVMIKSKDLHLSTTLTMGDLRCST